MARVIEITLNSNSIQKAIDELRDYERDLGRKTNLLRERIAEVIRNQAANGFAASGIDDRLNGGMRKANVSVTVDTSDGVSVVLASGDDAVWIEFGAGVYHNGGAGSSPNPLGAALGYTIGGYGKGHGKRSVWGYYDQGGNLVLTHGTPATMPMYNAVQAVCASYVQIAKEVFGT